jgi:hypothetical protein
MKKMGFFGVAEAITLIGDETLAPSIGLATLRGKSFEPLPQSAVAGSCATGAGRSLVLGDHVIGTGGVDGNEGWAGAGVEVVVFELAPHPKSARLAAMKTSNPQKRLGVREKEKDENPRIYNLRPELVSRRKPGSERRTTKGHQYAQCSNYGRHGGFVSIRGAL